MLTHHPMKSGRLSKAEELSFRKLEEEFWREETRFDQGRMDELFASDFFEFGGSGRVHSRAASLGMERAPINAQLPLPDFEARWLAPGVVQVTYNSAVEKDGVVEHRRRSSIWTMSEAGWVMRFHQGTPYHL